MDTDAKATIEQLVETETLKRFDKRQDKRAEALGYGATAGGLGVTEETIEKLSEAISQRLTVLKTSLPNDPLGNLKGLSDVLADLDVDVLAASTLNSLLDCIAKGADDVRATAEKIGQGIHGECWAAGLLAANARLYNRVVEEARRRNSNIRYRKQSARSMVKRVGWRHRDWPYEDVLVCGSFFLDCVLRAHPNIFCREVVHNTHTKRHETFINITPEGREIAEAAVEAALRRNPVFVPCVDPPKPWTGFRDGGYWDKRARFNTSLIRVYDKPRIAAITAAMKDGSMQPHVDGVNRLQSVAWIINKPVLEIVQWAHDNQVPLHGLPGADEDEPGRFSDETWAAADEETRRNHKRKISEIKASNRTRNSNRVLLAQDLGTAWRLSDAAQFFTPMKCDWRGRVYPVPHFGFQRDDRVRALFLFRDGMPIGDEGLWWLKVHVANCAGQDKLIFEERVAWTDQNIERIKAAANDPKGTVEWWSKTADKKKPFLFLAACLELAAATASGPAYLTRLPVSFDASCSGLQHMCAMTRAAEGKLVNLTASNQREDVYQTVADLVHTRIATEATQQGTATTTVAKLCLDYGISRKLVKRNVMTYCYAGTEHGMGKQHMDDLMRPLRDEVRKGERKVHPFACPALDVSKEGYSLKAGTAASRYLAKHIFRSIETVVPKPAQAKDFLQTCAKALAHEGKSLSWVTPAGLPWSNKYHELNIKRVRLWLSDVAVSVRVADTTPTVNKEIVGRRVSPNFVHALDAAHLLLTVNACAAENINNIATVHDSFGCLAPQARRFNEIIREQFVRLYEEHDVLAEILDAAKRDLTPANHWRLPELPAKGPLDLKEVLNAQFAFA